MGNPTTDVGDKAGHVIEVHLNGIGWREIMGHHDDISLDLCQIIVPLPHQIPKDSLGHVIYIVLSLPEVFILNGIEGGVQLFDDAIKGPFGVDPFGFNDLYCILDQHFIIQHHQMDVQDEKVPSYLLG